MMCADKYAQLIMTGAIGDGLFSHVQTETSSVIDIIAQGHKT